MRQAIDLRSRITLAQDRYGVLKSLLPDQASLPAAVSSADKVRFTFLLSASQETQCCHLLTLLCYGSLSTDNNKVNLSNCRHTPLPKNINPCRMPKWFFFSAEISLTNIESSIRTLPGDIAA